MAISHIGTGAVNTGTTSCSPAYSGTILAGDLLMLGANASSSATVTYPDIAGWTKVYDLALGGGSIGAGTGPRRVALYAKIAAGGESGTVTVTPTGDSNVVSASITAWRSGTGVFVIERDTAQDTTGDTNLSMTSPTTFGETSGSYMVGFVACPANSNLGSQTFNATGATYGTAAEHIDTGSNTGDDTRTSWMSRPVSSGTASAATVYTSTTNQVTGGIVFNHLREGTAPIQGGTATETSSALAGTSTKTVLGGLSAETSSAQAGTSSKSVSGATVGETGSAQAGTSSKVVLGSVVVETDTALEGTVSIDTGEIIVVGGTATETDSAQAGTSHKLVSGGLSGETDTALIGTALKTVSGEEATETTSALTGDALKQVSGGLVTETDTALAGVADKPITVSGATVTETDTALSGTAIKPILVSGGLVTETDTALAGTAIKPITVAGGTALETDSALAGTASTQAEDFFTVNLDTTAPDIDIVGSAVTEDLFMDVIIISNAPDAAEYKIYGDVDDDYAQSEYRASEVNSPWLTWAGPVPITIKVSASAGTKTIRAKVRDDVWNTSVEDTVICSLGGAATETDTALPGATSKLSLGGVVTETDNTPTGVTDKQVSGGAVTETDAALAGTAIKPIVVSGGLVTETNVALSGIASKEVIGGIAPEIDIALPGEVIVQPPDSFTVTLDTTAPDLNITGIPEGLFINVTIASNASDTAEYKVYGDVDDAYAPGEYRALEDDAPWLAWTGPTLEVAVKVSAPPNAKVIRVKVRDDVWNTSPEDTLTCFPGGTVTETSIVLPGSVEYQTIVQGGVVTEDDSALPGITEKLVSGGVVSEISTAPPGVASKFVIAGVVVETDEVLPGTTEVHTLGTTYFHNSRWRVSIGDPVNTSVTTYFHGSRQRVSEGEPVNTLTKTTYFHRRRG